LVLAAVFAVIVFGVLFFGARMTMDWLAADLSHRAPTPTHSTSASSH
jgi:hypothetical protein